MLKNNLINSLIKICIVLTLGIVIGFNILIVILNKVTISSSIAIQIDPINFIAILINVLLVVYVTRILNKKNEEERIEKDLLIKRLESFQNNLDKTINNFFSQENLLLVAVNARLKIIRTDFNSICGLLKEYDFISEENYVCNDIDSLIRDIKDFFTETPRNGEDIEGDIEINQDEISLGTQSRKNIEDTNIKIKGKIFNLVVLINRKK